MKIIYYKGLSMDGSGKRGGLDVLIGKSMMPGWDGHLLVDTGDDYELIPLMNLVRVVNDDADTTRIENLLDITKEGWKTV